MELWESFVSVSVVLMVTPAQCRAARGLIGWNQQELAQQAGVGIVTVHQLEAGVSQPRRATLEVIRRALESAGVEFIDENGGGPGVRLRKRQPKKGQSQ
jgi:transcriptional regulator with XRE-family HTH domain